VYHVELRQFPHNFCRFNMTERELRETVLLGWARGEWVDLGERKWNPQQATLTVIEGPRIPVAQLSMGRGWRNATRHGEDVTERLVAAVPADEAGSPQARGGDAPGQTSLEADSLGLEVLAKLSAEPEPIALAWRLARERDPDGPASDCLKLAELALGSLLRAQLIVLLRACDSEPIPISEEPEIARALFEIDGWVGGKRPGGLLMRRV
jgi:hypothetical protein